MNLEVLLFGGARAAIGSDRIRVEVSQPCTCAAAMARLKEAEPRLGPFVAAGRLAVNHAFAPGEREIREGDEVALIALVSGG